MDALGIGKGARMSAEMRAEMNRDGVRQGITRSMYFAGAVGIAVLVRLFVAMIRARYVVLQMFQVDPYTLMWVIYAALMVASVAALWLLRRRGKPDRMAMIVSLVVQTLCLLVGVTMAMATTGSINVLPYTTCMILFTLISTYPLGVTIPILAAAHGVFIVASLVLPSDGVTGAMIIDQTSVLALAVAALVIVYMSRRHAFVNAHLTAELTGRNDELTSLNRRLKALMLVDEMTGVSNRRGFDRDVELSWQHCKRQDLSLVICFMDMDRFRTINERHGRAVGNECLIALAQRLTMCLKRSVDVAARLGGEEFALLLPFTDVEGGLIVAERVREAIEDFTAGYPVINELGEDTGIREDVHITASIGIVAGYPAHDRLPVSELMRRAEHALRVAKQMGGNRVIPWKDPFQDEAG